MASPPSLARCLLTGVLLALGLDAALWAYAAWWLRSEFAGLGAGLALVFLGPAGVAGGLLLYARGRIAARRLTRAADD